MLIHEDAHRAAFPHELAGLHKTLFALEQFQAETRAVAAHLGIDIAIAERLKNRAHFAAKDNRRELRDPPPTRGGPDAHNNPAVGDVARAHRLEAFHGYHALELLAREFRE